MKMLRLSVGVTRLDKIRNTRVGRFGGKVKGSRLGWFGHDQRRDDEFIDFGNYDDHRDEPPVFLPRATNVSAHKGDTAVLTCAIKHLGTKTVIWRRASDPNPLTIGKQAYVGEGRFSAQIDEEKNEWRLVIRDVVASDAGVYECQISSRRKLIHHILLRVNVTARPERDNYDSFKQEVSSPAVVVNTKSPAISVTGTMFVEKGDLIHLVCNATGVVEPPENLDWFKDGIKLSPDGIRQIVIDKFYVRTTRTLVSKLEIKHSRMADAGTYVCRSSNLSITSMKVHVLNAGSINVRRGTSATDKAGGGNSQKEIQQKEDEARYTHTEKENNCSQVMKCHPLLICLTLVLLFCQNKQIVSTLRR